MDVYGILCIIAHKKIKEHDGGFIQMKKIISLLAALTLMCSTMVLPPVNAECTTYKDVNSFTQEYYAEWPDREADHVQVKENGFVFNVYDSYAYLADYENTDVTEVTIPDKINDVDVVGISDYPFGFCHKLESVTLPDTLKYFTWASLVAPATKAGSDEDVEPTVKEVKISDTNPNFTVKDGVLFSKDTKTLIGCPPALSYSFNKLPKETETIGVFAFVCNKYIKEINIPETVTKIQMNAFRACPNLTSVVLPKSVTEIQGDTFSFCPSLTDVKLSNKVAAIGPSAFAYCDSLKKFSIPDSVTYLGWNPFEGSGCIEVEDNVYYVGKWCVGGDKNRLTKLGLRDGTVGVAEMSFILANRITELYIPSSVKYLGTMFYQASRGELMRITVDCHTLNKDDLKGAKKMKDIYFYSADCKIEDDEATIPAKWKYIEDDTNYDELIKRENENQTDLSSNYASKTTMSAVNSTLVDLDENGNTIPDSAPYTAAPVIAADEPSAFLTGEKDADEGDVVIHGYKGSTAEAYAKKYNRPFEIIRDLEYDEKAKHTKFTEGDFEYMTDGEYAWLNACVNKDIKEAVIPEKVNGMCVVGLVPDNRNNYFKGCTKLEKLTINQHISPSDLAYMGTEDSPLTAYDIAPENDTPCKVIDGVIYSVSGKGILQVPNGIKGEFVVPDDVECILVGAFKNCKNITSVAMGNNVTDIKANAFEGCTSLENIKLSENLKSIDDIAFRNCSSLESVTLPDGINTIGHYAFLGCDKLKSISLPDSVTSIGKEAFPESVETEKVNGISYIGKWAVYSTQKELPENITLKDDTVGIASWGLNMQEKSTLNIPASIKYVSEAPYVYMCSNTVKIYGNRASSNLLSNPAIKDVYFYAPECDLNNCYINRVYNGIIVSASKEDNQKEYTTIHGYAGSTAETYAKANNLKFETIEDTDSASSVQIKAERISKITQSDKDISITIGERKPFTIAKESELFSELKEHPYHVGDTVSGIIKVDSDSAEINGIDLNIDNYGGDANCDNEVGMSDAVLIMQALANPSKYGEKGTDETHISAQGIKNADTYGDNDGMTNLDALAIQKRMLKLE